MKKIIGYAPLVGFVISIGALPLGFFIDGRPRWEFLFFTPLFGHDLFKNTLNKLQVVGFVYWITRDYIPPHTKFLSKGFMKETSAPWRVGTGIQIKAFKRVFQIGVCRKQHYSNSVEGELAVVGGRFMDVKPTEIGEW